MQSGCDKVLSHPMRIAYLRDFPCAFAPPVVYCAAMKPIQTLFLSLPLLLLLVACGPKAEKFNDYAVSGQTALRAGDWEAARDNLSKAADIRPSDGRLQYNLGQACLHDGHLRASARAFQRAADLLQGDAAVDALLGLARVQTDRRRWKDAEDALERARSCAPDYRRPDILATSAGIKFRQNLREAARHDAAEALDLRPDHPLALFNLGCIFFYSYNEKPAAKRAFNRYFRVLGSNPDAEATSRLDPFLPHLKGVQEGPSDSAQERVQLSNSAASPSEAYSIALIATQEDPLDGETWRNFAEKCLVVGKNDEAARAYRRFARLSPDSPNLATIPAAFGIASPGPFLEKAYLAIGSKNFAAAEKQYRAALAADPECFDALIGLESVRFEKNDIEGALQMAQQARALRPTQPDLLFRIGCYLAALPGRTAEAISYYQLFLQYGDGSSAQAEAIRSWIQSQTAGAAGEAQP